MQQSKNRKDEKMGSSEEPIFSTQLNFFLREAVVAFSENIGNFRKNQKLLETPAIIL